MRKKNLLITGGNGFIGQNFLSKINKKKFNVINIDCLTKSSDRYVKNRFKWINFEKFNICNTKKISQIFLDFKPDIVVNFAAHSHVDTSIVNSKLFLENINGTYNLLNSSLKIFEKKEIKFLQISTDEVFGSINKGSFDNSSPYKPNSPYSATKASSDHLVRAFNKTYRLPTITTYSCNNFGPYQHLEKLIPLTIYSFLNNKKMGIYGKGDQKRQWIFVEDNVNALNKILSTKFDGSTYCIGSKYEIENLKLVKLILEILNKKFSLKRNFNYLDHINFVRDRPGHDHRYFLNYKEFSKKFSWKQKVSLKSGIIKTIDWYTSNLKWINSKKNKLENFFK